MHLLTCYRSKFTIAAATLRRNPVLANTKQIVATAVPNTIGTQLIGEKKGTQLIDFTLLSVCLYCVVYVSISDGLMPGSRSDRSHKASLS